MRTNLFFANPRLSVLGVIFICVMGWMAYLTLARQEDPTMAERWAGVNTFMPGASAERMEALVSEPIETMLREIPEIAQIDSTSKAGLSVVGVQLYDSVDPDRTDAVWSEVRDKLSDVSPSLPQGASEPELVERKPVASTIILALEWNAGSPVQIGILSRLAESLRIQLANTPGTEVAESWGEAEEEILISLNPYRLAESGLTASQVAQRIRSADTKVASGRLMSDGRNLLVEVDAELDSPERISAIPLVMAGNGSVLRVSDVAEVTKHYKDPPDSKALHGLEPVIFVNAKMQANLQIESWTADSRKVVEQFRAGLPEQITLNEVYGQIDYTAARMNSLSMNLAFALIIVMLVLVWFMGVRSALTVGVALPLSGAMVLAGMRYMDIPLHQMSVTGLIISLGLLIDNAIVIVEEFKLQMRRGDEISDAISAAVKHLLVPLGASTATTIFAFMPIVLAPGGIGDFTGTIGVSVALAVASSFLLAMTIVPAIAGFLEQKWPTADGHRWWQSGFSNKGLTARYRAAIVVTMKRPFIGIAVGCVLPIIGFVLAPTLTNQFFPPVDRNQFQVQLELSSQSSLKATEQAIETANDVLMQNEEVTTYFGVLAREHPAFTTMWYRSTNASQVSPVRGSIHRLQTQHCAFCQSFSSS